MYIRTKDGVYEVVTAERCSDNKLLYIISTSKTENTTDWVHEADVISKADTIEELCDRFVVIDKETKEVMNIVSFLPYAILWSSCKYNIYGAVWCEWGLKYVAKMNDKGKLELI